MKKLFFSLSALAALAACDDRRQPYAIEDNEIIFGISQDLGAATTSADWEMLAFGGGGWRVMPWVDRTRSCFVEDVSQRTGNPHVDDGNATFRAPKLPNGALTLLANVSPSEVKFDGAGWASGDSIQFDSHGFAIPDLQAIDLPAPPVGLGIAAPADGDLTLASKDDLALAWDPAGATDRAEFDVMVALTTDEAAPIELRCFFAPADGKGVVPHELLQAVAKDDGDVHGTLRMGTHTQVDGFAGDWHVYIVGGVTARSQGFTLSAR
jgi:hypothetical protein